MEYISEIKNTEIGPDPNARINFIPYTTPWYFWGVNLPRRRFSVGRILALNTAAKIHITTKEYQIYKLYLGSMETEEKYQLSKWFLN